MICQLIDTMACKNSPMHLISALIVSLAIASTTELAVGSAAASLPKPALKFPVGWRAPSDAELDDDVERNDSPTKYVVATGDFNGDGKIDTAYILMSDRYRAESLWVRLSEPSESWRWIQLDKERWNNAYSTHHTIMAIEEVKPGVISYACFDRARECDFPTYAERPKMKLAFAGLMYFRLGSAASMYYWSTKSKSFVRVWLSD
jgi:hypothetical protein